MHGFEDFAATVFTVQRHKLFPVTEIVGKSVVEEQKFLVL